MSQKLIIQIEIQNNNDTNLIFLLISVMFGWGYRSTTLQIASLNVGISSSDHPMWCRLSYMYVLSLCLLNKVRCTQRGSASIYIHFQFSRAITLPVYERNARKDVKINNEY